MFYGLTSREQVRKICNESFDRERNKHAATQEYWLREKSALWLELYNLTSAVKEIGNCTCQKFLFVFEPGGWYNI